MTESRKLIRQTELSGKMRELYKNAFPREERAPAFLLDRRAKQGKAELWSFCEGDTELGLAYVLKGNNLAYLFYLAIEEEYRGQGVGTWAMSALIEQYRGCKFFLALESLDEKDAGNYSERVKRHDFYVRCGLSDLPYHLKEATVVYDIMGIGGTVEPEEYRSLMEEWMGWPIRHIVDMRILK